MKQAVKSLHRSVSPPPKRLKTQGYHGPREDHSKSAQPSLAAIEAGEAKIRDHLDHFARHLRAVVRPAERSIPRLSIDNFVRLYQRSEHDHGRHFVVHQHNHPVAGVHYDLRLQFSYTSTCSWAIPYGLPGNVNSRRQGRMAVETRVHTLWNNLIESASHATGSLLIWDTGKYEILPRKATPAAATTDDESPEVHEPPSEAWSGKHENEKLIDAFKARYIRLRLHGTRLPAGYTVTLRLPFANDKVKNQSKSSATKRRRKGVRGVDHTASKARSSSPHYSSGSEPPSTPTGDTRRPGSTGHPLPTQNDVGTAALASEDEAEEEAETIRMNNAYTGAHNTIGSIHQRNWYLSLDKLNSGFVRQGARWARDGTAGFEPFFVRGADVEHSIVTGRLSSEVMEDEGVQGFQPRKLWRPILT